MGLLDNSVVRYFSKDTDVILLQAGLFCGEVQQDGKGRRQIAGGETHGKEKRFTEKIE